MLEKGSRLHNLVKDPVTLLGGPVNNPPPALYPWEGRWRERRGYSKVCIMCERLLMACKPLSDTVPYWSLQSVLAPHKTLPSLSPCSLTPCPMWVSAVRMSCQHPGAPCEGMWSQLWSWRGSRPACGARHRGGWGAQPSAWVGTHVCVSGCWGDQGKTGKKRWVMGDEWRVGGLASGAGPRVTACMPGGGGKALWSSPAWAPQAEHVRFQVHGKLQAAPAREYEALGLSRGLGTHRAPAGVWGESHNCGVPVRWVSACWQALSWTP